MKPCSGTGNTDSALRCTLDLLEKCEMAKRRKITEQVKAKVALETLLGDKKTREVVALYC